MIPGTIRLEVKMTCVCGHVSSCEMFVMDDTDKGQAPLFCPRCSRHLRLQRVSAPPVIEVRSEDDLPKVH